MIGTSVKNVGGYSLRKSPGGGILGLTNKPTRDCFKYTPALTAYVNTCFVGYNVMYEIEAGAQTKRN